MSTICHAFYAEVADIKENWVTVGSQVDAETGRQTTISEQRGWRLVIVGGATFLFLDNKPDVVTGQTVEITIRAIKK